MTAMPLIINRGFGVLGFWGLGVYVVWVLLINTNPHLISTVLILILLIYVIQQRINDAIFINF
jgi:hypothetical protein